MERNAYLVLRVFMLLLLGGQSLVALALSGPETAMMLNQRLQAAPARCVGNQPEYACSGVLVRPMSEQHPVKFWEHDPESIVRGSEAFVYLRSDHDGGPLTQRTGYVLMSRFDALAVGKPYEVSARPTPGEVQVRNWDQGAPGRLAVEALYYDHAQAGALLRGQRAQLEWHKATGDWLPLLRHAGGRFGFDQGEQLYNGYRIARDINARYANTADACPDGSARYQCQGVLVRGTGVGNFKAWNPSPKSQKSLGVSFTYFAADAGLSMTVWPQGFIVLPLGIPVNQPLTLSCIYPFDGGTELVGKPCEDRGVCSGIVDKATWLKRYPNPTRNSCAFRPDPADFIVGVKAHKWSLEGLKSVPDGYDWNEPVVKTWPQDKGAELPLEAFFYSLAARRLPVEVGPANARRFQGEYLEEAGKYLPVLRLNPEAPGGTLVTFLPEDQMSK